MALTEAHAGRRYPPTDPYHVSAAKIAEFATALGDDNPNAVASCGCGHSFRAKDESAAAEYEGYDEGYAGGGCGHCGNG